MCEPTDGGREPVPQPDPKRAAGPEEGFPAPPSTVEPAHVLADHIRIVHTPKEKYIEINGARLPWLTAGTGWQITTLRRDEMPGVTATLVARRVTVDYRV